MKKRKPRKQPSLKWALIGIVLVCFVLPVFVFAASAVALITDSSERQTVQSVTNNFDSAVRAAQLNLAHVVTMSRTASYDPTIRRAYQAYGANGDKVALYGEIQGFLSRQYSYDANVLATMLFFTDDPFAAEGESDKVYLVTNGPQGAFNEMFNVYRDHVHAHMRVLSEEIGTDVRFAAYNGSLYLARNIMSGDYRPYAMIIMLLSPSSIFSGVADMAWESASSVTLDGARLDLAGSHVWPPEGSVLDSSTRYARAGSDYTIWKQAKLEGRDITYVSRLNDLPLIESVPSFVNILILALMLTVVLMALFISFFYRNITRPVAALTNASSIVQAGELGYQMNANLHSGEFSSLAASFNSMSARLKTMFEQNAKEQLALQDARIGALQSQINPHFLNNTLEIINWEARMSGAERVSAMIEALSVLLSGAMARDGESMVSVSDELKYLDSYLYIISARLGRRLRVEREVDQALLLRRVPRLIMQPLVENAVEHGVRPRNQGVITLRVYEEGNTLILEVENDGELMSASEESIRRLLEGGDESPGGRLGIRNVHERVKLIYGEDSGLSIASANGRTVARLKLMS